MFQATDLTIVDITIVKLVLFAVVFHQINMPKFTYSLDFLFLKRVQLCSPGWL